MKRIIFKTFLTVALVHGSTLVSKYPPMLMNLAFDGAVVLGLLLSFGVWVGCLTLLFYIWRSEVYEVLLKLKDKIE